MISLTYFHSFIYNPHVTSFYPDLKSSNLTQNHPCPDFLFCLPHTSIEILVLIGFNFKPMLSGEKSSGEMLVGLNGLLGLTLNCDGL